MSFQEVKQLLHDRSGKIADETSRVCISLLEGSKQDEYISSCTRAMVTKYDPIISTFGDQINEISNSTTDISVQIHQIDRRLQTMVQTGQSLDEILTKLKRMGFENEAKGIKDTRSSKPPQH
nr:unnamed protein product [Naegleria fowleri]